MTKSRVPGASLAKEPSERREDSTTRYGRAARAQDPAVSDVGRRRSRASPGGKSRAVHGRAIGVLVSGEGTNLQAVIDAGLPVVAVASSHAEARALERARAAGIDSEAFALESYPTREERDSELADWLAERGVSLVVCAGFMQLLTKPFLERFPGEIVNVHPSLLPRFPGAHAIEDALEAGVATTGVTVHLVDEGLDSGPILRQEPVPLEPRDTLGERIHAVEHRLLPEVVRELCARR